MAEFRPWRESIARLRHPLSPSDIAMRDRMDDAMLLAIEVLGDHDQARQWMTQLSDQFGGWHEPRLLAASGAEGLARVKAALRALPASATTRRLRLSVKPRLRPHLSLVKG